MNNKSLKGIVISNKMDKTAVVRVDNKVFHERYGKLITKSTKYYINDSNNICNIGDVVSFYKVAPVSKKKHWNLLSKI